MLLRGCVSKVHIMEMLLVHLTCMWLVLPGTFLLSLEPQAHVRVPAILHVVLQVPSQSRIDPTATRIKHGRSLGQTSPASASIRRAHAERGAKRGLNGGAGPCRYLAILGRYQHV
ncbi:hypothetical protein V8C43DRAFT_291473 [Trichoderma afarasin]